MDKNQNCLTCRRGKYPTLKQEERLGFIPSGSVICPYADGPVEDGYTIRTEADGCDNWKSLE